MRFNRLALVVVAALSSVTCLSAQTIKIRDLPTNPAPSLSDLFVAANVAGTATYKATPGAYMSLRTISCTPPLLCGGSTSHTLGSDFVLALSGAYIDFAKTSFETVVLPATDHGKLFYDDGLGLAFMRDDGSVTSVENQANGIDVTLSAGGAGTFTRINPGSGVTTTDLGDGVVSISSSGGSGSGTVTSVSGPSELSWATATTTPAATWANQTQGKVLASPPTSTGTPTFRPIAKTDIPAMADVIIDQTSNGSTAITSSRATDSSPTGAFEVFKSAAGSSLWKVDVLGSLATGSVPWARLTSVPSTFAPSGHHAAHEPGGGDAMAVDAAAATGSLRTLGTGAAQATAGNDARLSDPRAPNGTAGGGLAGSYPNPTVAKLNLTQATVVFSQSPYSILTADSTISCNAASGAVVLNLPAATGTGRVIRVKKTDSSANGCTLTRAGSNTIDGATTVALTAQYASTTVEDSGSGTWIRTHVNQLAGDATGASTALTVTKINGVALSSLATGILKNTTTTGALSIAVAADFPPLNQNTTGTAAGLSSELAVASGGTGLTTIPVHGVLVGNGIVSLSVTSPGTAGQVLTSNGASADPTFQTPSSGGGGSLTVREVDGSPSVASASVLEFQQASGLSATDQGGGVVRIDVTPGAVPDPLVGLDAVDDFVSGSTTTDTVSGVSTGTLGRLGWMCTAGCSQSTESGHPGIVSLVTNSSNGDTAWVHLSEVNTAITFGDFQTFVAVIRVPTSIATRQILVGLATDFGFAGTGSSNGAYFLYDSSVSANWKAVTRKAGTSTSTDTTVAASAGAWLTFKIDVSGSNVLFYVNGTLRATNTTNVPLSASVVDVGWNVTALSAAIKQVDVDYARLKSVTLSR